MDNEGIQWGDRVTLYYYGYKGSVETVKGEVLRVDTRGGTTLRLDNQDVAFFPHQATQRVVRLQEEPDPRTR